MIKDKGIAMTARIIAIDIIPAPSKLRYLELAKEIAFLMLSFSFLTS